MKANTTVVTTDKARYGKEALQIWNRLGMLIILVLLCVVLAFTAPNFLEMSNLLNVLKQVSINGVLAAGMTLVILTGGIDLSVGAIVALSGVVSVMISQAGVHPLVSISAGLLVGGFFGLVNGFFTAKTKLPAFIVTLGSFTYVRGLAYVISGGYPIVVESDLFKFLGAGRLFLIPTPIYIMVIVYIGMFFVLKYTMFGRHVYAIGGSEEAARLTGIKVERTLMKVYSLSGLLAGLAGVVLAGRLFSGQPTAGLGYELDAIAAVILGGTSLTGGVGRIQGTIIGVLIMGVISNGLTLMDVGYYWQLVVKGGVIIAAVLIDRLRSQSQSL
ncbi:MULTISPECIES: ABC transporter permease subunit [Peribacillus]|uniref:Ribose import permease protein RbsC n=1 Tax=Peribacillus simplex TaxID=1478 RepID=A0A9W4L4G0_9BACI|nr:ribose ABC transporter permease [Peribacillus simplex]MDR4926880.1 ribose ABC transporter permease [Peribacillus simplex]WHX93201.1 ribose ABC transporter permease [Peribacillus simplex]CAH0310675.1 Ribose import permease protein RbsC [Peribacillus simplex]